MKLDCLLAGVGGQGTVLSSKILAQTALRQGVFVRTSETIGMAQRGGSVVSHVRCGSKDCAPSIGFGQADLVVGFEPAETVRNIVYLKKNGVVVTNTFPITPITAALEENYNSSMMLEFIKKTKCRSILVDGNLLCKVVGSAKVLNVIMRGVLLQEKIVPFLKEQVLETLGENLPNQFLDLNLKALEVGFNYREIQEER